MIPDIAVKVAGLGRYLPRRVVTNEEIAALVGEPIEVVARSGVEERRWADPRGGESNAEMAARAAHEAIRNADLEPRDIDLILNASGTQQQAIPDGSVFLQQQLGLGRSGIPCFSVHATCLSFLPALQTAAWAIASGRHRRVLVVSSEVGSVGLNPDHPESTSLMGDGAAAAVITATPEGEPSRLHALRLETFGDASDLTRIEGGGSRHHPNHPDTRPEHNLFHMDGPGVLKVALRELPGMMERLEPGLRARLPEFQTIIAHQASRVGLSVLTHLGARAESIVKTLPFLGNTIGASIPLTLYEAVSTGRLARGQRTLLIGTGAGLSMGAAILTF